MLKNTKKGVVFFSIIILISIFILLNLFILKSRSNQKNVEQSYLTTCELNVENLSAETELDENLSVETKLDENLSVETESDKNLTAETELDEFNTEELQKTTEDKTNEIKWKIEIPAISLIAEIAEGTTKQVMDDFVGHFENTSKTEGNIGLAAHNRGYFHSYFLNLKKLKEGDEIIYRYNNFEKIYEVEVNKIIKDTDWSYLEEKEENTITLITCVENEPNYRRCVQAVEKEVKKSI